MALQLTRYWWALALRGVVAVIFGIVALVWPSITLGALILVFGAYALVDGVLAVLKGVSDRGAPGWWALLIEGLAGIAIGVLTFLWPTTTALVLLYFIAAWAVVTGIFEIVAAVQLRHEIAGEWLLALGGVLSIVFGVLCIVAPGASALAIIWLIGAYALVFGIVLIALGFRLRGVHSRLAAAAGPA